MELLDSGTNLFMEVLSTPLVLANPKYKVEQRILIASPIYNHFLPPAPPCFTIYTFFFSIFSTWLPIGKDLAVSRRDKTSERLRQAFLPLK